MVTFREEGTACLSREGALHHQPRYFPFRRTADPKWEWLQLLIHCMAFAPGQPRTWYPLDTDGFVLTS